MLKPYIRPYLYSLEFGPGGMDMGAQILWCVEEGQLTVSTSKLF